MLGAGGGGKLRAVNFVPGAITSQPRARHISSRGKMDGRSSRRAAAKEYRLDEVRFFGIIGEKHPRGESLGPRGMCG